MSDITPELAAKVLAADIRNIVKKVSEGGILSPSERSIMQNAAFPASAQKAQRAVALALKYADGGRLTADELAQVRELHPGFAPEAVAAEEPQKEGSAPAGVTLQLTSQPSPANGDGRVKRVQLDAWSKLYGVQHRQLRRMIERGKECGEPCPLDDPRKMPAWVEKHVEKVRAELWQKVCAAAEAAGPAPAVAIATPAAPAGTSAPAASSPTPAPNSVTGMSIDLATVGGVEGESVELFRRLFAAAKLELEDAYKTGTEERKRTLHTRLEKVGESLRKHEAAAEATARRRGELLSRPEVFTAIAEALNMLRLMREHRIKRVLAKLPALEPEVAELLTTVLEEIGQREEAVLANLPFIKTTDDLLSRLAA